MIINRHYLTNKRTRPALSNPVHFKIRRLEAIVVHWTANTARGANAAAHRSYFNQGLRSASAHYVVDDHQIIQCIPDDEVAYHCGDRPLGQYKPTALQWLRSHRGLTPNFFTVGVEMCVNAGGNFTKTRQNAIQLIAFLLVRYRLPLNALVRHFDVTGKNCPKMLLEITAWTGFQMEVLIAMKQYESLPRGVVNTQMLNVRSGPSISHPVVNSLLKGEPVLIFERRSGWVRVEDEGWVNGQLLTESRPT